MDPILWLFPVLVASMAAHLGEEVYTGFRRRFPLGEMPVALFAAVNVVVYAWAAGAYLLYLHHHSRGASRICLRPGGFWKRPLSPGIHDCSSSLFPRRDHRRGAGAAGTGSGALRYPASVLKVGRGMRREIDRKNRRRNRGAGISSPILLTTGHFFYPIASTCDILIIQCLINYSGHLYVREMRRTYKKFHGISAIIEPKDADLYRALLSDFFDMPDDPRISLTVVEYVHVAAWPLLMSYREGAIGLKSRFNDDEGWFVLDMPVTKGIAAMAGRRIGLPKRQAESIEFMPQSGIWEGKVIPNGRELFSVKLVPDGNYPRFEPDRPDCPIPAPPFETAYVVRPPRVGSRPRATRFEVTRLVKETPSLPGTARVRVDSSEEWAGLVDEEKSWPGVYFQFWGVASVRNRPLE